jgi:hypothetical protein
LFIVARGGTKRITVPAKPQSMVVEASRVAGVTVGLVVFAPEMFAPRLRRASIIKLLSRETRAPAKVVGSEAKAAKTSSRLVSDLDPGSATVAASGFNETGAAHWE